ncbi:MAG TPA: glycosyl hydrolase 108 family protein [Vicinamibacteria bacterium]|nr:glycosyl hydrolase 108 family protein [Vicinamibacteria bacterium]
MPSPALQASLSFVLRWEGGYVDHPADPGGRTNRGITQAVYDRWRVQQGLTPRHVGLIEDAEVEVIYETGYWVPPRCDLLRRRLDLVQFDTAVNMGPVRAVRLLQGVLGCGVDGAFGPRTARAAAECGLGPTVEAYCEARLAYYLRLVGTRPDLRVFLRGWTNRVNALRAEAGLPGFVAPTPVDLGDAGYIARIPDVGVDPAYDLDEP